MIFIDKMHSDIENNFTSRTGKVLVYYIYSDDGLEAITIYKIIADGIIADIPSYKNPMIDTVAMSNAEFRKCYKLHKKKFR